MTRESEKEKNVDYFDCHADTLTEIPSTENLWENNVNLDLKRVHTFAGKHIQVFALWRDRQQMKAPIEQEFRQLHARAMELLQAQKERAGLCRTALDMKEALAQVKTAAFLSIEDCSIMGNLVEQIEDYQISFALLTWNYENEYGMGAVQDQGGGLTDAGRTLVKTLCRKNIIPDISHLSNAGAEEVFRLTDRPVIASHSNVRAVCEHARNLSRQGIQEIIRRGGLIGMNFYAPFVAADHAGIEDLLRHMDAILAMGGEDVLALGTDFDGSSNHFPEGICGVESVPKLREEMLHAGFGEELTEKILFANGYHFIERNLSYKIR